VYLFGGKLQGTGQGQRTRTIMLQQMKRHARGRLDPNSWQTFERLDQNFKGVGVSHRPLKT
jgi:hypothetical protein